MSDFDANVFMREYIGEWVAPDPAPYAAIGVDLGSEPSTWASGVYCVSPAGRMQAVLELAQCGAITADFARELLTCPDLEPKEPPMATTMTIQPTPGGQHASPPASSALALQALNAAAIEAQKQAAALTLQAQALPRMYMSPIHVGGTCVPEGSKARLVCDGVKMDIPLRDGRYEIATRVVKVRSTGVGALIIVESREPETWMLDHITPPEPAEPPKPADPLHIASGIASDRAAMQKLRCGCDGRCKGHGYNTIEPAPIVGSDVGIARRRRLASFHDWARIWLRAQVANPDGTYATAWSDTPVDPLDVEYDGVKLNALVTRAGARVGVADGLVAPSEIPGWPEGRTVAQELENGRLALTAAQRVAVSAVWSAELRKRVQASEAADKARRPSVVIGIDAEDLPW